MFRKSVITCALLSTFLLMTSISWAAEDVYWYLGAAMKKPAKEIVDKFNQENKSFQVVLVLSGSGQLLSKISASQSGDIYTPGSEFFLHKAQELGIVKKYRKFLVHYPVFGVSNPSLKTLTDLAEPGVRIALGNTKAMAMGKVYLRIEKKMDPKIAAGIRRNKVVEALNAPQIIGYLRQDVVDAGILPDATARVQGIPYIEIPAQWNIAERAYFIRLTYTARDNEKSVDIFERYLYNHLSIFTKHGYHIDNITAQ
jgi:molybdate transport system substrate-binding protein